MISALFALLASTKGMSSVSMASKMTRIDCRVLEKMISWRPGKKFIYQQQSYTNRGGMTHLV
jgi:hypothetical protein